VQFPHVPRSSRRRAGAAGISAVVALTVAAALGGYALALGFTGIPVLVAAVAGVIAAAVLVRALAD
jgi:hypothetical protein